MLINFTTTEMSYFRPASSELSSGRSTHPAAELLTAAIKERTLERTKRSLGIESRVTNVPAQARAWHWCPPEEEAGRNSPDRLPDNIGPVKDAIRRDLPKDMFKEASEILAHVRLDWAIMNPSRPD